MLKPYTFYKSIKATKSAVVKQLSFEELYEAIVKLDEVLCLDKNKEMERFKQVVPTWSPSSFENLETKKEKCLSFSALVLDIDNDRPGEKLSWNKMESLLRERDLKSFIVTSPSHTNDGPRFRVVIDLAQPINPSNWEAFTKRTMEDLNLSSFVESKQIDFGCTKDLARRYFYGAMAQPEYFKTVFIEGNPLSSHDHTMGQFKNSLQKSDYPERIREFEKRLGVKVANLNIRELIKLKRLTVTHDEKDYIRFQCPWVFDHAPGSVAYYDNGPDNLPALSCFGGRCSDKDLISFLELFDDQILRDMSATYSQDHMKRITSMIKDMDKDNSNYNEVMQAIKEANLDPIGQEILLKSLGQRLKVPINTIHTQFKDKTAHIETDHQLAEQVIQSLFQSKLMCLGKDYRRYGEFGYWEKCKHEYIKNLIVKELGPGKVRSDSQLNSIANLVRAMCQVKDFPKTESSTLVNCKNGVLDLSGGEVVFHKHDSKYYFYNGIPASYEEGATSPRFDQFCREIFEGGPDIDEKVLLIHELLGYCLLSTAKHEKFFILYGKQGQNGKSILIKVAKALLGSENCASVKPSDLKDRFKLGHLRDKLANLVAELKVSEYLPEVEIKSITSGDTMTAEHKGIDPFDFNPVATQIFACNHLPNSYDLSNATGRRAVIIEFPRTFTDEERDPELIKALESELSGILNRAIEGALRLVQNGGFTLPVSTLKLVSQWVKTNNPTRLFLEEMFTKGDLLKDKIRFKEVYEVYANWCYEEGYNQQGKKRFKQSLSSLGYRATKAHGGNVWVFGLKLVDKVET